MNPNQLPAGPRSAWLQLFAEPYDGLLKCFREYGDPMTFQTLGETFFVTAKPEGIKTIMTADPDIYEPPFGDSLGAFLGAGSLLMLSGSAHRAARKILAPPFHGARMRAYGNLMRATTLAWTRRWEPGRRFAMQDTTQAITLDIIIQAVFGVTRADRVQRFHETIVAAVASFSLLIIMFKFLRHDFLGLGPWVKFQRHVAVLRQLFDEELVAHRASPDGREDVLSMLLLARYEDGRALTEQEIFEQLVTLLMAGHETTSIALAWTCYFLHRNPETLATLRAELATLGDNPEPEAVAALPYLEAVCNECLRLRPFPMVNRKLARPLTILGYELPAGILVGFACYAAHMRADIYPQPAQFRPERFLGRTYSPFEYMPFGGGARRCIGAAFGLYEMKIVLATLLAHNRLELAETGPVKMVYRSITVGPKEGIRMVLKERLPVAGSGG